MKVEYFLTGMSLYYVFEGHSDYLRNSGGRILKLIYFYMTKNTEINLVLLFILIFV